MGTANVMNQWTFFTKTSRLVRKPFGTITCALYPVQ